VLRRIFGPKVEYVAGCWKGHYYKLHNLHISPGIIRDIKSRMLSWAGFVAYMGEMRNAYKISDGNLKGKEHSEDLGVDRKII